MSHRSVIECVVDRELFLALCLESARRDDVTVARVRGWTVTGTDSGDLQVLLVVESVDDESGMPERG